MSAHQEVTTGRLFTRFNLSQRIQHIVQIISFSTLCLTGIPQRYNQHPVAEFIIQTMGGIDVVRTIHRTMAVVFILETIYHAIEVAFLLLTKRARPFDMLPTPKDAFDALQMLLYFVGLRKERARFGRYDFRQKSEYLSLIWGGFVMIVSGSMMWFPVIATRYLPGELVPAAKAAHSGEGLLAFLAILIWHMYSAHLGPDVFPFDKTVFTGKISEERMLHEHPLEYERIIAAERKTKASSDSTS